MNRRRAKVLINGAARVAFDETLQRRLTALFAKAGVFADVTVPATVDELAAAAQRAIEEDFDLVVAGGGDGTVSLVASALVGTGKSLGILPLGTLNHFARDLRIPLEFEAAVQNLLSGVAAYLDVAEVNGRFFLNNSSLGLYPTIVREREKHERLGSGKWPAFVWAAIAALRRYPFVHVRVIADEKMVTTRTPFVFVGNNHYAMERLNIGTRERLDEGELCLYLTKQMSRLGLLRLALRALFGRLREEKDFLAMSTRELTIHIKSSRARVALDGEVAMIQTPLEYKIRPRALSVIVPSAKETEA